METNPRLRFAIQKAREANMPQDNIERAIAKADPSKSSAELFEVLYEAYAPGGSALLIEGVTDNKNRTAAELRRLFTTHHGNIAGAGSVSWIFQKKGLVILKAAGVSEDRLMDIVLEAGAEELPDPKSLFMIADFNEGIQNRVADRLLDLSKVYHLLRDFRRQHADSDGHEAALDRADRKWRREEAKRG